MADVHWQMGCQFGNHGEPFLWRGSGDDDVDIAIMQLINLANDNPKLAKEAAEFVDACIHDAAQQSVQRTICTVCNRSRPRSRLNQERKEI